MPPTIEQVIAAIPDWAGRKVDAEPIAAGLTNTNYRVEVDGTPYFVRIPGAVDGAARGRPRERAPQHARGGRGRGRRRRVAHALPELGRLRARVADGRTMSNEALRRAGHAGADRRRRSGGSTPARASATTSTCSGWPSATSRSSTSATSRSRPAIASTCPLAADRGRAGAPSAPDRPVPQRPAGRELPRRRRRGCGSSTTSTAATTTRRSSSATRPRSSATTRPR